MENKSETKELSTLEKIEIIERNTKKSINLMHRPNNAFSTDFELGSLNYDSPLSIFVKSLAKKDDDAFVFHKEILNLNGKKEKHYLLVFKDEVIITHANLALITNPMIFRFNFRAVIIIIMQICDTYVEKVEEKWAKTSLTKLILSYWLDKNYMIGNM